MSKIELIRGSSAEQNVDALVNAANNMLMSGGGICGVLFKKAGYIELTNACKKYEVPLKDGDAVITPAFKIENAKYISGTWNNTMILTSEGSLYASGYNANGTLAQGNTTNSSTFDIHLMLLKNYLRLIITLY